MKIKHHEIIPSKDKPFIDCKLDREPYARILTDIVRTYADGFVLAINNEWGEGKTTFVKMWQQQLENEKEPFKTIYFNAWENDFDTNPLVAIMSELRTLTRDENSEVFNSILKKGAVLVKNIVPSLAKSLIKKHIVDIDDIVLDVIENATKATTEIFEEKINEYTAKKKTIVEFRKELEKFVKLSYKEKPLVFIVDELDRCRPSYAVEVLEQIKHLFSVPGIVFVLSIDKKHLGASIKGFYGSDHIDSDEYLRRFIDLEYSIPAPKTKQFIEYLFGFYQLSEFFLSKERMRNTDSFDDGNFLLIIAETLFTKKSITLRQQERIFALTRLILSSFKSDEYVFSHLLFVLIYLKIMQNRIFQGISKNEYTLQELSDIYFENVYTDKIIPSGINLLNVEALLLWLYNNDRDFSKKEELTLLDESGNLISIISSKLEKKYQTWNLVSGFNSVRSKFPYNSISLEYLINKINLMESVNFSKGEL